MNAAVRGDWLAVGIFFLVQTFAAGGFVWNVSSKLTDIGNELHELNGKVTEGQIVTGKIVEHLITVDRRLDQLEGRR